MRRIYRVIAIDPIPPDLKQRIASIHASAILSSKNMDTAEKIQGSKAVTGRAAFKELLVGKQSHQRNRKDVKLCGQSG